MEKKNERPMSIYNALVKTLTGWDDGTYHTKIQSSHPHTYNYNDNVILRTKDKSEYEAALLQGRQDKWLSKAWVHTQARTNMRDLQSMGYVDLMYRDVENMCQRPEIYQALNLLASECCTLGPDGSLINITSKSERIKFVLEDLFINRLQIHMELFPLVRTMLKYGNEYKLLNIQSKNGILAWHSVPVVEMRRFQSLHPYGVMPQVTGHTHDDINQFQPHFEYMGAGSPQSFHSWQCAHFRLMNDMIAAPYGCCLSGDTRIETEYGYKEIKYIQKGDKVWSFDIKTQEKKLTTVEAMVCSGQKEIIKIRTKHNFVDASKEHRFLVYENDSFIYKTVEELQIGDRIVINNSFKDGKEIHIDKSIPHDINYNKRTDWWFDKIQNVPDIVDEEFAQLFGFMIGDGWLCKQSNGVMFSLGEHNLLNKKYIDIVKKLCKKKPLYIKGKNETKLKYTQVKFQCKMLYIIFQRMGFSNGFDKKRIPQWVYESNDNIKKAFLNGIMDADGSYHIDKWNCLRYAIEVSNEQLIKDIKILAQSIKYKTGKIGFRNRIGKTSSIKGTDRKITVRHNTYYLNFFETHICQSKCKDIKNRFNDNFIIETITSKEHTNNLEYVYDIQVGQDFSNFYANGIVVHNSYINGARQQWRRLMMAEDHMLIHMMERAYDRLVYKIDIGLIDDADVEPYIQEIANRFKRTSRIDPQTGQIDFSKNVMSPLDDYFIPVRGNNDASKIETLAGTSAFDKFKEILEYLHLQMLTALGIPKVFLSFEASAAEGRTLSMTDIRFAKIINRVQQCVILELNKIAIIHLYLLGFVDDLNNFTITMNSPSTQVEITRIEEMQKKILACKDALSTTDAGMPIYSWKKALKEIMKFSDSEISKILEDMRFEKALATELSLTQQIIKKTGAFDKVDTLYGDPGAQYNYDVTELGQAEAQAGGGGGGGAGGGGEMGMEDMAGAEAGGEGAPEEGGAAEGGAEAGGVEAGATESAPMESKRRKKENLIIENILVQNKPTFNGSKVINEEFERLILDIDKYLENNS